MVSLHRDKCLMLIKEEPVSPGVRGGGGGAVVGAEAGLLPASCEVCSGEPPVLPVAMVQSVLEGRGSVSSLVERRSKRGALERWARTNTLRGTHAQGHTRAKTLVACFALRAT